MEGRDVYLDRCIYVEKVVAPLVGEAGYRAVRRPGEGAAVQAVAPVRVSAESVRPGMRMVDGRWLYSARWL